MKRLIMLACVLALVAVTAWATTPYVNNAVSVTDTSQTLTLTTAASGLQTVLIVNKGANEVFVCPWTDTQTAVACTSALGFELTSGESASVSHSSSEEGNGFTKLSIVCSAGETATAKVWAR